MSLIVSYDIGSTTCKVCVYRFGTTLELLGESSTGYGLVETPNGGIEQDPDDWWQAMASATGDALASSRVHADEVRGIAFCAQMQGLVLVDRDLKPVRPAMSYMDQRAGTQREHALGRGIRIAGMNARILAHSMAINGAVAASVKDPVWKYKWVEEHEPEKFGRVHRWLDVKDYAVARATGVCTMTEDSAFPTFLTDQRRGKTRWSPALLRLYGVNPDHMPTIIRSWDVAGHLLPGPATELGLPAGTPVFGGGGDASMIALGAGASRPGDTYVYTGTSGWVSVTVEKRTVDVGHRIAAIVGAQPGRYHFFGEQETAGKCLEWVKDHLALDEIDLYLSREHVAASPESRYRSLYDFLIETISQVPAGAGGVIFAPWLHGNRAPFEDEYARGVFFNIGLTTGKRMMIRAVVEGIIFHQKWLLESARKHFRTSDPVRFTGGGALSPLVAQIMADVFETPVETLANPVNSGTAGAALTAARGLGVISDYDEARASIPTDRVYTPDPSHAAVYRRHYDVFKRLYPANRKLFRMLNG